MAMQHCITSLPVGEVVATLDACPPWHVMIEDYTERMCAMGFAAREHMTREDGLCLVPKVGPDLYADPLEEVRAMPLTFPDNEGYRAQALGFKLHDNPYIVSTPAYTQWRRGYLDAFKDSH